MRVIHLVRSQAEARVRYLPEKIAMAVNPAAQRSRKRRPTFPAATGPATFAFVARMARRSTSNAGSTFPVPKRANTLDDLLKERRNRQSANVVPQPNATPRPNSVSQTTPTPQQPKAAAASAGAFVIAKRAFENDSIIRSRPIQIDSCRGGQPVHATGRRNILQQGCR